jgi:hypothetical protein
LIPDNIQEWVKETEVSFRDAGQPDEGLPDSNILQASADLRWFLLPGGIGVESLAGC